MPLPPIPLQQLMGAEEVRDFLANEIQFAQFAKPGGTEVVTVAEQQEAFERFIGRTSCLRRQRGRILERNSCREPWSHTTTAAVRQGIPIGGRALEVELDARMRRGAGEFALFDFGHSRVR